MKITESYFVRFEVLMMVTMKNTNFWGVTLCSVVEVYHHIESHTASIFSIKA
jgi:hypothetical protein